MKYRRLTFALPLLACSIACQGVGRPGGSSAGGSGAMDDAGSAGTGGVAGGGGSGGAGGGPTTDAAVSRDGGSDVAVRVDAAAGEAAAPRDVRSIDMATGDLPPTAAGCGFATVVTPSFFDAIFPPGTRNPLYSYAALVQAAQAYPEFVATGDVDTCKKEAAAFLANVKHETGSLKFAEQIAKDHYCQNSGGCPCDPASTDQSKWYYGRGALQLSWNYNYCSAGAALGADLAGQPSLVSSTPVLAWKTAIWFWMKGGVGRSCHSAMLPGGGGFGETIRTINGAIECNKGGYGAQQGVTERVRAYLDYAGRLGVTGLGTPQDNDC